MASGAAGANIRLASELAGNLGWTVAMGIDIDAGAQLLVPAFPGITFGGGIYFGPGHEMGLYGSIGADVGAILGVSIADCATVVAGPPSLLAGTALALETSVGAGIIGFTAASLHELS